MPSPRTVRINLRHAWRNFKRAKVGSIKARVARKVLKILLWFGKKENDHEHEEKAK